jgi:hypothetical protein
MSAIPQWIRSAHTEYTAILASFMHSGCSIKSYFEISDCGLYQ